MTKAKTFLHAITISNENFAKAKSFLTDKRLTQVEKLIIQAYIDFRERRFAPIIENLSKHSSDDPFVESQRNMFLGLAYNGGDDITKALPYFLAAWENVQETDYIRSKFFILYNLFILHRNLKIGQAMANYLDLMEGLDIIDSKDLQNMLLRCRFFYCAFIGDLNKAHALLVKVEKIKDEFDENQIMSHQIDKFDFYIKSNNHSEAYNVLAEMKQFRVYASGSNFKFMKILLDHLSLHKPVYAYDKDFKDCPVLFYQLSVVKALEAGDKIEAEKWWHKLSIISPTIYQANLQYKGDKCLFSEVLQKNLKENKTPDLINIIPEKSKELTLLKILQNASGPLKKEDIYYLVWNQELTDKSDLMKLSQLVTRVKKKFDLVVKTRRGCYYLEQQPLKKVS